MSQAAVQPTPQGVNSTTFKAPSLDHGLSLAGLYEYHAKNSPNHAAWAYAEPDTRVLRDITYAEAWDKIKRVATTVSRNMASLPAQQSQEFGKKRPVIGVLALSDTLSYMYLIIAIISLGYTAFPLSPRNSAAVTAHLLESMGVVQLYASKDAGMQTLAREAIEILAKKGISVETIPMITPEDHESATSALPAADVPVHIDDDDVTIILHSSGTTAFPKPIPITKLGLINLTKIPCYGEVDLAGKRVAAHTNPSFHSMGLATMIWPPTSGAIFSIYPPVAPPIVPTPANFLDAWVACKCNIVFCVPVFIEAWARDPANLPKLQALDCIVYCGASVNKGIGDMLASSGVTLHPFWGSTEVGPATMLIPRDPPPAHEWDYFKISNHLTLHMEPQDGLENIYEPIHIPTDICFPQVTNAERDGKPVFAVGDLLERHPTDPKRWKVFGRKDDQIMLSTGENVNPLPIEGMLVHDPRIASALMFGRSRIEPGVLIEPANGIHINPEDKQQLEEYIDSIWPTVEKVNARFPAYANIKRNMIVVTSPKKPLEYTPKGTPRRGVCLKLYGDEIEDLYTRVTDASPENREFPDRM
ncbi:acetyl-CoA synthetase-like protein [Trametes coccinea BRFM310]|uniref:Acetyl-CoA synthetase-like protein n=1 Tax=Trametes coccinea (strain BRFM310) TaxID=1353009 RepID=A0A1Y2ICE2_TRAC3|nr:acetyl-CoA synthetase-like protein [Trametes coccinea BRFM310]